MTATILYYGITDSFFENAFSDIEVTTQSSVVVTTVDRGTGYQTVLIGNNLSGDVETGTVRGTLNSIAINDEFGNPVIAFGNISWSAQTFLDAIVELLSESDDDSSIFLDLLNLQPIDFDASASDIGGEFFFDGVTQPITIQGSENHDTLSGGDVNDTINPGNTPEYNGNVVFGSLGSDTIDLSDMGENRWFDLTYEEHSFPLTVDLDGTDGTLTVEKGTTGTDTVLNIENALGWGVGIYGSRGNDTFNVTPW